MPRILMAIVLALLPAAQLTAGEGSTDSLKRFEFERKEMGVEFRISLYACNSEVANHAVDAAYARIRELNGVYSDYTADSELRRLCAESRPGNSVRVSEDLWLVLEHSLLLSRQSAGAFDITVGSLTKLWRRARRQEKLPDSQLLADAKTTVGFEKVRLLPQMQSVELMSANMRLDLGGIAKGRAADEALRVLQQKGISAALVNGSGDLSVGKPPPGRSHWTIDVAALDPTGSRPAARLKLANCGVATSGDAFQSVEIDGRRYSHIVDPRTGLGLSRRSSVTVIAPTGMDADCLASALSVMPVDAGLELLEHCYPGQAEALIVLGDDSGKVEVRRSRGFSHHEGRHSR